MSRNPEPAKLSSTVRKGYDEVYDFLEGSMTEGNKSVEAFKLAIRSAGLRATPTRIAVLQLLQESDAPLTHAEVAKLLANMGIDGATVFRSLNGMTQAGLLRKAELGDHVWRFEAISDAEHDSGHPHFLCVDCGTVTCLGDVKLTSRSRNATASVGEVTEILVRGHCNACT